MRVVVDADQGVIVEVGAEELVGWREGMVTTVGPRREDEDDERICIFLDALSTANTSNGHLGQRRAVFRYFRNYGFVLTVQI